uniref:Uncharacterized protein n=1 Tax=Schizaphis graminum TaxID=13262 RepID=A0A2S2NX46_SCHGA
MCVCQRRECGGDDDDDDDDDNVIEAHTRTRERTNDHTATTTHTNARGRGNETGLVVGDVDRRRRERRTFDTYRRAHPSIHPSSLPQPKPPRGRFNSHHTHTQTPFLPNKNITEQ